MTLRQLWSIIRGRRTNFKWMNASWTYYPDGDPLGKILMVSPIQQAPLHPGLKVFPQPRRALP